ncbi:RICIN domain-containing protein [Paraburkholderia sp. EG287A]|uniref:RICIN domain-containing protein n=1 Tax=unclassified Paraburkholderia TaxID=2615204 RepID=UPI0034D2E00D
MTAYVIQSLQNSNLCIGATSAAAGSLVTLQELAGIGGKLSQWNMDPNSGYITLAADPTKCLDIQGFDGQKGQVIVADLVLGRNSQLWNWVGRPPYISNVEYPTMVLDNSGGITVPGNPVLIWPYNGGKNQEWSSLPVPTLNVLQRSGVHLSGSPKLGVVHNNDEIDEHHFAAARK